MNDALRAQGHGTPEIVPTPPLGIAAEIDGIQTTATLPGDHPSWQRDVLSVSSRVRALMATIKPVAIAVFTYWDHRVRELVLGHQTLSIDPCGSYHLR